MTMQSQSSLLSSVEIVKEGAFRVRTPLFPTYSDVHHLLELLQGVPKSSVLKMIQDVRNQTGTPQNPVDWTDPDIWIRERLLEESAELAEKIWLGSKKEVNPRHLYGSYLFISRFQLLETDHRGSNCLSNRGAKFLECDFDVTARLDRIEGLDELLSILSTKQRAMRGDLIPEWRNFLKEHSKFGTPSTIKDTLRRRLVNLVQRGYIDRSGNTYSISKQGLKYLERLQSTGRSEIGRAHV